MHIVITGASSGIGAALARELALVPHARLTLAARSRDRLAALADELSCDCHVAVVDLSQQPGDYTWLESATEALGPVDVLLNNAGVQVIGPTHSVDADAGESSVVVNMFAPLRLSQRVLPSMIERRAGTIVNIASMAALAPTPSMTYYNASKAGLAAASEALAGELRNSGVNVLTVYPGIISETDLAKRALGTYQPSKLLSLQPTGSAATLAKRIRRAIDRKHKRLVYPRVNGLARWFPGTTRWLMDRFTPALRGPEQTNRTLSEGLS